MARSFGSWIFPENKMKQFIAAATFIAGCALCTTAHATGALAVAEPADIVKEGYAVGIAYNQKTAADAERIAIEQCQTVEAAPLATRKLCKIVRTFDNQCGAAAIDPEDGTPGAGWAVAETLAIARRDALQRCEDTAGRDRKGECRVTLEGCDGKAK
jgi:hypothetical protein